MKTPITLEDPRLTAYALGELSDADDLAAVEQAILASPELQGSVNEIRALGETLTVEFAEELLPEDRDEVVVRPKCPVWRYVAPLGIAAAIAVFAAMLVTLSKDDVREFRQQVVVAVPTEPKSDVEMFLRIERLRQNVGKAEERMNELVERYGIDAALFDTRASHLGNPVVGTGSQWMASMADSEAKASMLTRRQIAEYSESRKEVSLQNRILERALRLAGIAPPDVPDLDIAELRRLNEEAKAHVDDLARRYRIIDLASVPKDQVIMISEPEPIETPVSEDGPDYLFGWASESYQTIIQEAIEPVREGNIVPADISDERQKYKEYSEARQIYERTTAALLAAEESRLERSKLEADESGDDSVK